MIELTDEMLKKEMQQEVAVSNYLGRCWLLCSLFRRTEEGERRFFGRIGGAKQLCDEMVPIGYFCNNYLVNRLPHAKIALKLGSQNFDARIVSDETSDNSGLNYIEVTCLENQREHLERTELYKVGRLSTVRSHADWIAERTAMLKTALEKKTSKEYPQGTVLIIYIKETSHPLGWEACVESTRIAMQEKLRTFKLVCMLDKNSLWLLYDENS